MAEHVLDLRGITRHFGAVHALDAVDLSLARGEVLGLMGDNGAGKSTLVKIIAGNFPPTSGTVVLDGEEVTFHSPLDARQHGIEIVYQDLALCNNLTASLNVFLGRELTRGMGPFQLIDRGAMKQRASELLDAFGNARVLWIYRHYEDTACSSVRKLSRQREYLEAVIQPVPGN